MKGRLSNVALALTLFFAAPCVSQAENPVHADKVQYNAGDRRDPMIPLVTPDGAMAMKKEEAPLDYKVEGIIFDPREGSIALINGQFYKVGDSIQNAQLVQVYRDRVVLLTNDVQKVLWLREESEPGVPVNPEPTKKAVAHKAKKQDVAHVKKKS